MTETIDYTPLDRRPTRDELERVRAEAARGDFGRESQKDTEGPAGGTVVGGMVGGLLVFVGVVVTVVEAVGGSSRDDLLVGFGFVVLGVAIGVGVGLLVVAAERRAWRRTVRLVAFARANDLGFQPYSRVPKLPGIPRRGGHTSTADRMTWTAQGSPAEMASYHRSSGGSTAHSVRCLYLAVRLDVDLPAMTFSCGRRGAPQGTRRAGPDLFEGSPHSLTLGSRRTDERATTLFSDPVVALLTDAEHSCNAEYVDGWFLAYYRSGDVTGESRWRHAFTLADTVAATTPSLRASA